MAPLFANRPGEAEQGLHELSDRAPYNMDIRTDYASSMRARGWPHAAEQELRRALDVTRPRVNYTFTIDSDGAFSATTIQSMLERHPDGAPGVPALGQAYAERCRREAAKR